MKRYRINVVEEIARQNRPVQFQARADLGGTVEADTPSAARKVASEGIARDKRFAGMTIVSIAFRDKVALHVIVRSVHLSRTYHVPGGVYKAPPVSR